MDRHLDPERLAAFMEGSVTRRERAQIERHAADCPDCMEQLAVMARTAGAGAAAASASASAVPRFMRWAVPAAVAATALAVWINVDDAPRERPVPVASQRAAAPQVAEKDARASDVPSDERASAVAPPPRPAQEARQVPRERAMPLPPRADGASADKATEAPLPVPEAAAAASSPAAPVPAPLAAPQPLAETVQTERRENAARSLADTSALIDIRSPDAARRWRVRGRLLERSLDGGRTWQVHSPALTIDALAGSAPSGDVAWLAGRGGAVLRTTDGQQWARVPFPDAVDLTAILATSALEAVVTTADGRRFRTTDGGLTWVVQESPASPF